MGEDRARALLYTGPGSAEIAEIALPALQPGWIEAETRYTALSRGTERLVAAGRVPESEHRRMRAPFQWGEFPFPVAYGYAAVGRVTGGDGVAPGTEVFALTPHQDRFRVPAAAALPLPPGVPPARAVLAANAETALNVVWDADPRPGSRVAVIGLGLVGLLITFFLSRRADLTVIACDPVAARAEILADVPVCVVPPEGFAAAAAPGVDVAIHTSATAAGLAAGLDALLFEGRLVEVSWFGADPVPVPLGGAFHSQRLTIQSSQVGHVAPSRRAGTTHRDRLAAALALLDDPRLDRLITGEVAFDALPGRIADLLGPGAAGIATRISYE